MDDFPSRFYWRRNSSLTRISLPRIALPFRRIGFVASSGSFIKRTAIATDLAAPLKLGDLMTAASNKRFILLRFLQGCHNRPDDGLADGTASR
jgi:hypothetical protein